jgi:hypothetical protein
VRDDVFQVSVAHSIDLEENSNFHVFDDNLDVNAGELNVILSSSGQAHVDEDDNDDIYIEDCDGADDDLNDEEEEENSD